MAPKKNIQLSSTRGRRKGKKTPSSSSSKAADPYVDLPADTGLPDTPVATLATPATHVATPATLGDVLLKYAGGTLAERWPYASFTLNTSLNRQAHANMSIYVVHTSDIG